MYIVYFDSGTTNTRGYLIKNNEILYSIEKQVGSKDVSLALNVQVLFSSLNEIYEALLRLGNIKSSEISQIYGSGMLTSPYGIAKSEHLLVPANAAKIAANFTLFEDAELFPRSIKIVNGLKTMKEVRSIDEIPEMNNMRGEEIEILGAMAKLPESIINGDFIIVMPGSHTHMALIKNKNIVDIFSEMSGELFYGLTHATVLSESTKSDKKGFDESAVKKGFAYFQKYGMPRAVYIAHAMKVFEVEDNFIRKSYLSGVVIGSVVQSLAFHICRKWWGIRKIVVTGNPSISHMYEMAIEFFIKDSCCYKIPIEKCEKPYSVEGLLSILSKE